MALPKDEMVITTFVNGRQVPSPLGSMGKYSSRSVESKKDEKTSLAQNTLVNKYSNRNATNESQRRDVANPKFRNAYAACNFIVTWDGEDVYEVLDAIRCAREYGDRFIQDKLIEYILNIPFRNPRPFDIPAFIGKPVWAVDKHGHALIGMPGSETIVDVAALRELLHSGHDSVDNMH